MNEKIKESLRTIFIIILFFFAISTVYYIGVGWDELRESEQNKKREEFCISLFHKNSDMYDRCISTADDYDIK